VSQRGPRVGERRAAGRRAVGRRAVAIGAALLAAWASAPPAASAAGPAVGRELAADAVAQAFTLRASADQGGAAPIHFYVGAYADAYLSAPPGTADGQASWYNFGVAETALFQPPGTCTPAEQARRARQAVRDLAGWLAGTAIPSLLGGSVPVLPLPTLPCAERLPGFAQSRWPATETIPAEASDDLLGSVGPVRGGVFTARAGPGPSQTSDAETAGIALGPLLHASAARATARAAVEGSRVVSEATWTMVGLCVAPGPAGCALEVASIRQTARVVRDAGGAVLERRAETALSGVRVGDREVALAPTDLRPGAPPIDLGGRIRLEATSATGGCGDPAAPDVADVGGLRVSGSAAGGPGVSLPLPLVGTARGGALLLGGACAAARARTVEVASQMPLPPASRGSEVGRRLVLPGVPGPPGGVPAEGGSAPALGRVVRREAVRYALRPAPAWRTAPWWGGALAGLALVAGALARFRRHRLVAPVWARLDRVARQFLRG
jgi:hypothetical protein